MKILFLTSRFPYPPIRGDKIRVFNQIRELSKNHEIVLATYATPDDGRYYEPLKKYVKRIERVPFKKFRAYLNAGAAVFSKSPLQVAYYSSPGMRATVERLISEEDPDIIHAHLIRMAPYALGYPEIPKVLDICDSMTLNYEHFLKYRGGLTRLLYALEKTRTKEYESTVPYDFDANLVVSPHDHDFISGLCPDARIEVVPMGVDTSYFKPAEGKREDNLMAFMGTMSYFPNIDAMTWFGHDILPIIRRTVPHAKLSIVGSDPTEEVEELAGDPAITVTGYVDDVRPFVAPATAFVCPIRAATGLNTKVLEAMAMGLPVIATPEACEGIGVDDGVNVLYANDPMTFSERVIEVLQNHEFGRSIGLAGREHVKKQFTWAVVGTKMEEVYNDIL
jgi:sugar transferase (PEP-CTERM/EpsH1 system associated)